ncbi:DPP IV N-terminal domain-containing protein [Puniceicoccaceae bacterium K14]|nr:DPP IV N-terminal domain-containing protein [Puniceicoccaceae bacterium K14]
MPFSRYKNIVLVLWVYLFLLCWIGESSSGEVVRVVGGKGGRTYHHWVSPDGKKVCYCYKEEDRSIGSIWIADIDGSNARKLEGAEGGVCYPKWSPDGKYISYRSFSHGGNHLWKVSVDGGEPVIVSDGGTVEAYDWSPEGDRFVWTSHRGIGLNLHVGPRDGGSMTQITFSDQNCRNPKWSPRGDLIAFRSNREVFQDIYIVSPEGTNERRLTSGKRDYDAPWWSPDGSVLVAAGREIGKGPKGLWLIDLGGNETPLLVDGEYHDAPMWSSDGKSIFFISKRGSSRNVWEILIDSKEMRAITSDGKGASGLLHLTRDEGTIIFGRGKSQQQTYLYDWVEKSKSEIDLGPGGTVSPDGSRVAYRGNGNYYVRGISEPKEMGRQITWGDGNAHSAVWSEDSTKIAYVTENESQDVWIASVEDGGEAPLPLANGARDEQQPKWSPDGTYVSFLSERGPSNANLWICRLSDGEVTQVTHDRTCYDHTWSPDGKSIAITMFAEANGNPELLQYELESGLFKPMSVGNYSLGGKFSPDGKSYLFVRFDDDINLYSYNFPESSIEQLTSAEGNELNPQWSSDGKYMVYLESDKLRMMDLGTREVEAIGGESVRTSYVWLSKNGSNIIYTERTGSSGIFSVHFDSEWGR